MTNPWDIFTGNADHDRRNMAALLESVTQLYGPDGLDELPQHAVDRAIRVTTAERGILFVDDGAGPSPTVARDRDGNDLPLDVRFSTSAVERVWSSGEAFLTVDAADAKAAVIGQSILDLRLLSIMATPLTVAGRSIGILYVDSTVSAKEFTQAEFMIFNALGGIIGLAIENRRFLKERLEKERMERQLSLAHDVQRRLLPDDVRAPAGYQLAGAGRPCEDLSGDYYDVIHLADGRVALVVGDVSGHGIGPALYMASTRALIHALLGEGSDVLKVVETLNRFLARDMPDSAFMSLFLGVLDPERRLLTYGSAGHNPPLLVRASGGMEQLRCTGPVLSVFEDAPYRLSGEIPLGSGDALVLYTDGIYEAHDEKGEMYGEERFHASLEGHVRADKDADAVVAGVIDDLSGFCAGHPLDDDITCLVLRVE